MKLAHSSKIYLKLTPSYGVSIMDGVALLHHDPVHWFYFATAKGFHRKRMEAYRALIKKHPDGFTKVMGKSYVINYARDGFQTHIEPARFRTDGMGFLSLWLFNWYNMILPWRFFKVIKHLSKRRMFVGEMAWDDFKQKFR